MDDVQLQHGVRSLIIEIDNRARTIGTDFGLPTAVRDAFDRVESWIAGFAPLELRIPWEQIESWKAQFRALLVND